MTASTLIRTLRCPMCGELPDIHERLSPYQAQCRTNDCATLFFDMTMESEKQLASPHGIDNRPFALMEERYGEIPGVLLPRVGAGSKEDRHREVMLRFRLHRDGFICVDGGCRHCEALTVNYFL